MATSKNSKTAILSGDTLSVTGPGTYEFKLLPNGKVQLTLADGQTTVLSEAEFDSIHTLNLQNAQATFIIDANLLVSEQFAVIGAGTLQVTGHATGVTFIQASSNVVAGKGNFETSVNLDVLIKDALSDHPHDMTAVLSQLSINGNVADSIKAVWDYLDDHVTGYYDTVTNESFIRLGVEYAKYVKAGGAPLTDVVAKFTPDGGDAGTTADRLQSMHDNLLGNFNGGDFNDRFSATHADPALKGALLTLMSSVGWGDLRDRPPYSGSETDIPGHDGARVWDYAHGIARPDYVEHSYGTLDPASHDAGNNVFFGAGNSAADYVIGEHVGAGLELGLKVHYRTGDTVQPTSSDADGTAHFTVDSGYADGRHNESEVRTDRAAWNFDFSIDTGLHGATGDLSSFHFKLLVDTDASANVSYLDLTSVDPLGGHIINSHLAQDSVNFGFGTIKPLIDGDPSTAGFQPYSFGPGHFDILLQAEDNAGHVLASSHIVVDVSSSWIV